jgi:hypothetical protein
VRDRVIVDAGHCDEQVLGADAAVTEEAALLLGQDDGQSRVLVTSLERHDADSLEGSFLSARSV